GFAINSSVSVSFAFAVLAGGGMEVVASSMMVGSVDDSVNVGFLVVVSSSVIVISFVFEVIPLETAELDLIGNLYVNVGGVENDGFVGFSGSVIVSEKSAR